MSERLLISQTVVYQGKDDRWYWYTKSMNGKKIGDSGQGYVDMKGAVNGFFAQQGFPDFDPSKKETWPENFGQPRPLPTAKSHYVISAYRKEN